MSAIAVIMAAAAIFITVVLFVRVSDQQNAFTQSRIDINYQICDEQNDHHDKAFRKLDQLISDLPPSRRARAKAGEEGTKELLNTIAPKQKCLELVKRRFGDTPRPSVLEAAKPKSTVKRKSAVHPGN